MSGRPDSYFSQGGSAADAYNSAAASYAQEAQGSGMYDSRPTNSAGYAVANDDEDDDEDWNVYDDFNMTRPLSSAPGRGTLQSHHEGYWDASTPGADSNKDTPYTDYPQRKSLLDAGAFGFDVRNADPRKSYIAPEQQDKRQSMLSGRGATHADPSTGIELITVPALGTEFTKEEMRDMTRKTKKKKKRQARSRKWGMWARGEDHLWGWLSPRVAVFMAFGFLIMLGVMLYFVIPRVPTFAFLSTRPVDAVPDGASMVVNHSPTNFSMDMNLNLRANNMGGWIPSKASSLKVKVTDLNSFKEVGLGELNSISFPGRKKAVFQLPVHFSYSSINATGDQTFLDFYQACGPKYPGTARPSLNLGVQLTMKIAGLIGKKGTYSTITNLECPFELQKDQ